MGNILTGVPIVARTLSGWRSARGLAVWAILLGLVILYLYLPTFAWLGKQWLGAGLFSDQARDWSHGVIVVVLVGYLLWRRRAEFSNPGLSPAGLALVLGGIGLHMVGAYLGAPYLSGYSFIVTALGALWLFFGPAACRRLAGALLLLALAVPFPATEWGVTPFLARVVAFASVPLARLAGAPVVADGTFVSVGPYQYVVEPLCSGFNFVMALLALTIPLLYLRGASLKAFGASLLWAPALGLLAKTLLVSAVLFLTPRVGQETALVLYHRWLGIPFYLASLALAAAIVAIMVRGRPLRSAPANTNAGN